MRKSCVVCRDSFEAKRPAAKYCGERCKKRAQRAPDRGSVPSNVVSLGSPAVADADGPVTEATRAELVSAGRADSALGRSALAIAERVDAAGGGETGSGFRALVDGHRAALAEAMRDAERESDPLDEIRRSAALKLVAG